MLLSLASSRTSWQLYIRCRSATLEHKHRRGRPLSPRRRLRGRSLPPRACCSRAAPPSALPTASPAGRGRAPPAGQPTLLGLPAPLRPCKVGGRRQPEPLASEKQRLALALREARLRRCRGGRRAVATAAAGRLLCRPPHGLGAAASAAKACGAALFRFGAAAARALRALQANGARAPGAAIARLLAARQRVAPKLLYELDACASAAHALHAVCSDSMNASHTCSQQIIASRGAGAAQVCLAAARQHGLRLRSCPAQVCPSSSLSNTQGCMAGA